MHENYPNKEIPGWEADVFSHLKSMFFAANEAHCAVLAMKEVVRSEDLVGKDELLAAALRGLEQNHEHIIELLVVTKDELKEINKKAMPWGVEGE